MSGAGCAKRTFYDLRAQQSHAARKTRVRNGRTVRRKPETITGIVLHQTAVNFGVSERQVKAAGGDEDFALARRGPGVACHAIAFRRGFFVATHPLEHYVHHGNGLNATTLGLEVDGRYSGLADDPATLPREDIRTTWGGTEPTALTEETLVAARAALRWLVETGRAEGMPIEVIYAHRQSSATRRSDPGELLWRELVLGFAVPELGLRTEPALVVGSGRPVPRAWDPKGLGPY